MTPRAVVFDCDGVLVDSEPHSVAAWLAVLAALGHPARANDVEACVGLGFAPTWERLRRLGPLPSREDVWDALILTLEERFRSPGLERFPDAAAVLNRCLTEQAPVAVVSASPRRRLDLTLEYAGLSAALGPVSISGDDVARPKPAPDAYLAAADLLGVLPDVCVAIEDTPTGAASALAAGMSVVAVVRAEALRWDLEATGATVVDTVTWEALMSDER